MDRTAPSVSRDPTRPDPIEDLRATARRHEVHAGDRVVVGGLPRTTVFLVASGLFAQQVASADGGPRIEGFRLAGALLGVDAFGGPCHGADAVALGHGCLFEIDAAMVCRSPELFAWVKAAIAREQGAAAAWSTAMARHHPRQRVAAFLLDIAARHAVARMDPWSIPLAAYRPHLEAAIGVGCADIERELAALAALGLVERDADDVEILDLDGLRLAADPLAPAAPAGPRH